MTQMSFKQEVQPSHTYYSEVDLFSTQGRLGRRSYFIFSTVIPFICFAILASLAGVIFKYGASFGTASTALSYLLLALGATALLFIMVRLTILRCHDFNASGLLATFSLIPFANIIFSLIPGNNGLNSYGDEPEPPTFFVKVGVVLLSIVLSAISLFSVYKLIGSLV